MQVEGQGMQQQHHRRTQPPPQQQQQQQQQQQLGAEDDALLRGRLGKLQIDASLGSSIGAQEDTSFESEILVEAHAAGSRLFLCTTVCVMLYMCVHASWWVCLCVVLHMNGLQVATIVRGFNMFS